MWVIGILFPWVKLLWRPVNRSSSANAAEHAATRKLQLKNRKLTPRFPLRLSKTGRLVNVVDSVKPSGRHFFYHNLKLKLQLSQDSMTYQPRAIRFQSQKIVIFITFILLNCESTCHQMFKLKFMQEKQRLHVLTLFVLFYDLSVWRKLRKIFLFSKAEMHQFLASGNQCIGDCLEPKGLDGTLIEFKLS